MTDPELPTSGISWREYVDMRFTAASVALQVAQRELDRRLEDMNQFRDENRRQAATSVSRDVHEADISRLEALIAVERESRRAAEGALSTWRFLASFFGITGLIGVLLGLIAVFGSPL